MIAEASTATDRKIESMFIFETLESDKIGCGLPFFDEPDTLRSSAEVLRSLFLAERHAEL
jgi:hypothetical protein